MLPHGALRVNRPLPGSIQRFARAAPNGVAVVTAPTLIWTLAWFNLCNTFFARPPSIDDRAQDPTRFDDRDLEEP